MKTHNALPLLPYGEDIAVIHKSAQHFGDLIESVFPGVSAYDPVSDSKSFRSKTVTTKMQTSTLVASAISPTYVERRNNPSLTFMLPITGREDASAQVGDKKIVWGVAHGGVFLPQTDEKVIGTGGFRSQLMWNLDRNQLVETAKAIMGEQAGLDLRLDIPRLLPQSIAGVSVDASIAAIMPLLSLYRKHPELLSGLGVEDFLYRQTVLLLCPEFFEKDSTLKAKTNLFTKRAELDNLCEYIMAHLSSQLTLTELEMVSGMSSRSLQLAFQKRFACTPMAWIREQRLMRIRSELLGNSNSNSIEATALAFGFTTMPSFFMAYKQRFGETPGQTRRRVIGDRHTDKLVNKD